MTFARRDALPLHTRTRASSGQCDQEQRGSAYRLPKWRSAGRLLLPALSVALAACASMEASHEGTVADRAPAQAPSHMTSDATGPGAPADAARTRPAFTQRIDGTTVTLDMVQLSPPSGGAPSLWMSRTEITWDLYNVYLYGLDTPASAAGDEADGITRPSKPYVPPDRGFGTNGYPAIGMTFHAAEAFCQWLSARTGRTYRLPTEEEWAAACSAGGSAAEEAAWHTGNAANTTHPVGRKPPNELGLCDMLGNVAEWARGADGKPVACGGSYLDAPGAISCDTRQRQTPAWNTSDPQIPKSRWWLADCSFVGFRVVCEGEAAAP